MTWNIEKLQKDVNKGLQTATDDVNGDVILSEGLSIRIGGKLVKLEVSETTTLPEDEIRQELTDKFNARLAAVQENVNTRVVEMSFAQKEALKEIDKKSKELDVKLQNTALMPEINYEHAVQGLSVVKGHASYPREKNVYTWLYSTVYWPKFIDNRPIDPKFSKKLVSPITIEVVTVGDQIRVINVKKTIGLGRFVHYHSMGSSDCWGSWKYQQKWTTVEDVLSIAKQAQAVLENINTSSLGTRAPKGLSRIATIKKHIIRKDEKVDTSVKARRQDERIGITQEASTSDGVWGT